jgi:hypothetical protein
MPQGPLVYRQRLMTRITHWIWAVSLFFLMLTGLQIFNAHPSLHIGKESGFEYDNAILQIGVRQDGDALRGVTRVLGVEFDTTGVLGVSNGEARAFPAALTIPPKPSHGPGDPLLLRLGAGRNPCPLAGSLGLERPLAPVDPKFR